MCCSLAPNESHRTIKIELQLITLRIICTYGSQLSNINEPYNTIVEQKTIILIELLLTIKSKIKSTLLNS